MKTLSLLAALALAARLAATPVASTISDVTVYPDRAVVTREAAARVAPGVNEFTFERLPAALMGDSLQLAGRSGTPLTILDVTSRRLFVDEQPDGRLRTLQEQARELEGQLRAADDAVAVVKQQREFITRLQVGSLERIGRDLAVGSPRPDDYQQMLRFIETNLTRLGEEERRLDRERESLRNRLATLRQQMAEISGGGGRQAFLAVTVRLEAREAAEATLALSYAVPGAAWQPAYEARLGTGERVVDLAYGARVQQATGEDWTNVRLTLSTARPAMGGAAPENEPWVVDVALPVAPAPDTIGWAGAGQRAMPAAAPPPAGAMAETASQPLEATRAAAAVEAGATSATFRIAARATVPGDNSAQRVGITSARLPADLLYLSTPRFTEAAFLLARTTNTTDFPFLAGPAQVFLDGTFVATSELETRLPGEKLELALGVDDGLVVRRKLVRRFSEVIGIRQTTTRVNFEILLTVKNNKRTAEKLELREAVPVSRNEKIAVRVLAPAEGDAAVTRDREGRLTWKLELKPGESREIPLRFHVEHPNDTPVIGL